MKKTKLIPLILAVLLLLTACAPAYPNTEKGKQYGYFTYNGLEYGISEEEFLAAMGEKAGEVERVVNSRGDLYYQQENAEFFGKKATVQYSFSAVHGIGSGLLDVYVIFEETVEPNELIERIEEFVQQEGVVMDPEKELRVSPGEEWLDLANVDFTEREETRISVSGTYETKTKGQDLDAGLLKKAKENFELYGSENGSLDTIMEKGIAGLTFFCQSRYDADGNLVYNHATLDISGSMWILEAFAALEG